MTKPFAQGIPFATKKTNISKILPMGVLLVAQSVVGSYASAQDNTLSAVVVKEKAEQASKARADFLSTVSHELRTPLNAINGITHLLIEENPKESQVHYLNSLKFSGNYLLNFINDILEINRLESDKVVIEKISFNLTELVENIKCLLLEYSYLYIT